LTRMVDEPLDQDAAVEAFRGGNRITTGAPCVLGEEVILQRMHATFYGGWGRQGRWSATLREKCYKRSAAAPTVTLASGAPSCARSAKAAYLASTLRLRHC
jgi:hypothetical protein